MLKLMMLTHDPVIAKAADEAGVDRIFYDLEYINKRERQHGRNTVISEYDIDGITDVKNAVKNGELVELGNHNELINIEDGVYKHLYESQFTKVEASV